MSRLSTTTLCIVSVTLLCLGSLGCGGGAFSTPDGTVSHVAQSLHDHHPEVLWDALPASYQQDIVELKSELATRLDADLYDQIFRLLSKTSHVLSTKKELFLASEILQRSDADPEKVEQHWDGLTAFLDTITASELSTLETLNTLEVRGFLTATGKTLMDQAAELSKISGDDPYDQQVQQRLAELQVEVLSRDGDKARLKLSVPDEEPEELDMVRVEERWIPQQMAEQWPDAVAKAREELAKLDEKKMAEIRMQAAFILGAVEATLDQLAKVETTRELEENLGPMMAMFQLHSLSGSR